MYLLEPETTDQFERSMKKTVSKVRSADKIADHRTQNHGRQSVAEQILR
jgi:hypothetical protein